MSPFDPKAYENEVLKALRKQLPHLSGDLLTRYAVRLDMPETEMRERVKAVVQHWNKVAMRSGQLSLVCQQLKREHDEHRNSNPAAFDSLAWWVAWEKARNQRLAPDIADLAQRLKASYGALGAITPAQLRLDATAHGDLGDAGVDQARRTAGLELVEPIALPTAAGTSGPFKSLANDLLAAGVDSLVRLVHPGLTEFGVLGGVTVEPAGPEPALSAAAILHRATEFEKLPDGTAVRAGKTAMGFLRTELRAGTDFAALALFHLLVAVREKRADGVGALPLYTLLTRTGLRGPDAARITFSVLAEAAVRPDPVADVTDLLAEGQLEAARRLATMLPGAEGDAAREMVQRQRGHVEELRRGAREDLAAGRDEQAGDRLRQALALATDLPGLAQELAAVPAPPARAVTANADGAGVRITWQPAPGHDAETEIRIVRGDGRAPADADDGRPVAVRTGQATFDEAPPVGRLLHYAAFARAGGGPWSRAASAQVRVVPPVTDLVVEGGEKIVVARWRAHPDASWVEVTRRTGEPERAASVTVERDNRSFRDTEVTDGVRYRYAVVACYETLAGTLRSAAAEVSGATRPRARPVTTLSAAAVVGEPGLAVRLSWRQRTGSEVVIRRSTLPCPWEYGETVGRAELDHYGEELDGDRTERGESITLVAPAPTGRSYCVPFTIGPQGGVRGQDAVIDLSGPVRQVRAQRFGDDLRVTWCWPDEVSAADVVWPGGRRRITRQQYREEGGCELRQVPGVTRVEVRAVVPGTDAWSAGDRSAGDRSTGDRSTDDVPATAVEVDRLRPRLRYVIRRRGHRLAGGVRCTVTVTAGEASGEVILLLVASAGPVMPLTPDLGHELLRKSVSVGPGEPVVLPEVTVPNAMRKPYWLRCFLVQPANALLVDPPTSQLKVS